MKNKVPGSVYILGFISFFNDMASEMLYPIMPIFLTQVLGAPVAVVGIIDGIADGAAAIFKTIFGRWSDRIGKRKPFIFSGYLSSALSKILIASSSVWGLVFLARVIDKFGKGLRTGARDALLLSASTERNRGLVFGVHRSIDSAGAVVGPLIAIGLLQLFSGDIPTILYFAAIPSFIAVGLIFLIKEPRKAKDITTTKLPNLSFRGLPKELKVFLVASGLFALGNSSDSFLILRAEGTGLSLIMVILAYVLYNVVYSIASIPAGKVADKIGAEKVFAVGVLLYALVYLGFAFTDTQSAIWVLFALYGLYIALTDGVSKALVGRYISKDEAAGVYGLVQTVTSLGILFASVLGGFLWTIFGPTATFAFGAACAFAAFIAFIPNLQKKSLNTIK